MNTLEALSCVEYVFPSEANFLLVRFKNSRAVYSLLKNQKIIVRDRSKEKNCSNCLRITVGTALENNILMKALYEIDKRI